MGSIPNGSAPLQACARQIFKITLLGCTRRRKFCIVFIVCIVYNIVSRLLVQELTILHNHCKI